MRLEAYTSIKVVRMQTLIKKHAELEVNKKSLNKAKLGFSED